MKTAVVFFCLLCVVSGSVLAQPSWGTDPDLGTLMIPGVAAATCGTIQALPAAGQFAFGLFDLSAVPYADTRPLFNAPDYHDPSWHVNEIGNVFGVELDPQRNIYLTASSHYGAGFFGATAIIRYGNIGGGVNDLGAAGTIYKIDAVTGQAAVFAQLPQQSSSFTHVDCEAFDTVPRMTGPALGNVTYDAANDQLFVSNFEDGRIYRLDMAGNILSSLDPLSLDDGSPGFASTNEIPYGLAVSPDGNTLYFGTHGLGVTVGSSQLTADLYAVALTGGDFGGAAVFQTTLMGNGTVGGGFTTGPWISISSLDFLPNGQLVAGIRTGCQTNFATSHNHGGTYFVLQQGGGGLFDVVADNPRIHYQADVLGPDDGYGGVGIYDRRDGTWDNVWTSGDIISEPGPHGMLVFPHNYTTTGNNITEYILEPTAAVPYLPSTAGDFKGVGGDVEVLDVPPPPMLLGSYVWLDHDQDGIQDPNEPGIPGATVELFSTPDNGVTLVPALDNFGGAVPSQLTDGGGLYLFEDLPPADYVVRVTPPPGYDPSPVQVPDPDGDLEDDSNIDGTRSPPPGSHESGVVTLALSGEPTESGGFPGDDADIKDDPDGNMTVDFGFVAPMSLGSTVFIDDGIGGGGANNATQDGSESGVPGVAVRIYKLPQSLNYSGAAEVLVGPDGVLGTADDGPGGMVTNATGDYFFQNLMPGDYIVVLDTPPAVAPVSSTDIGTTNGDNQTDSDDNGLQPGGSGTAVMSPVVNLTPATETSTEPGQAGSQDDADDDDGDMTIDFGFVPLLSLGSTVFLDSGVGGGFPNNAIQDGTEPGIAGVTVQLFDSGGTEINVGPDGILGTADDAPGGMVTNGTGDYFFQELPVGDYQVVINNPPAASPLSSTDIGSTSADNQTDGDDNGIQVGGAGTQTVSPIINLLYGAEPTVEAAQAGAQDDSRDSFGDMTVDFGFVPLLSLGSTVFLDDGTGTAGGAGVNNGVQDGTEPGIPGVTVQLFNSGGTEINVGPDGILGTADDAPGGMVTNATGDYFFQGLVPGDYQLVINTPPAATPVSSTDIGTSGADNQTDGDDNGAQPGGSGTPVTSPIISLQPGAEPTTTETAQAGTQDDSADPFGDMTIDFGFQPPLSLGSTVFLDGGAGTAGGVGANNGLQDGTEAGIPGVTVQLFDSGGTEINVGPDGIFGTADDAPGGMVTNATGDYFFQGLAPGDYQVVINTPPASSPLSSTDIGTSGADNQTDGDDNGAQAGGSGTQVTSPIINLAAGMEPTTESAQAGTQDDAADLYGDMTVDFGFVPLLSLGSTVFLDDGTGTAGGAGVNNGVQDGTEPGIPGVTVQLFDSGGTEINVGPDGILGTADDAPGGMVTNATGDYFFQGLVPGDYQVVINTPPAATPTSSTDIGTSGADNQTDGDDNGAQPGGSGTPVTSPVISLQPGAEPTTAESAQAGTQDDAADPFGDMTVDFGFQPPLSLGSTVFLDSGAGTAGGAGANNGLQDGTEAGIPGVTVQLFDSGGTEINVGPDGILGTADDAPGGVVTNATGDYFFQGLPPGDYQVVINNPPAATPTSSTDIGTSGTDNQTDGDDNGAQPGGSGTQVTSPIINLASGMEPSTEAAQAGTQDDAADLYGDMTVDFGFVPLLSLGSTVFLDNGAGSGGVNNGLQDGTEPGIAGVTVQLFDSGGMEINVGPDGILGTADDAPGGMVTNATGDYFFQGLTPGDYQVVINDPPATTPTSSTDIGTSGADNQTDGDDNGAQPGGSGTPVSSPIISLQPGAEPSSEPGQAGTQDDAADPFGDMTVDFGFQPPLSLGNYLWFDWNDNGEVDSGEPSVPAGVQLSLLDGSGAPVSDGMGGFLTTTTDAAGNYLFDDLAPDDYIVEVDAANFQVGGPLEGFWSSTTTPASAPAGVVGENNQDHGIDDPMPWINGIRSAPTTLAGGSEPTSEPGPGTNSGSAPDANSDLTLDFGFTQVALGNKLWYDLDNDGLEGASEPPVVGALVELLDSSGAPVTDASGTPIVATSDASGFYYFSGIPPGDYRVRVAASNFSGGSLLSGSTSSTGAGQSTNPEDNTDANDDGDDPANPATTGITSGVVTLAPSAGEPTGEPNGDPQGIGIPDANENLTVDFGILAPPMSLGNRLWFDDGAGSGGANNGLYDGTELGVVGAQVNLLDAFGTVIAMAVTDASGYYLFDGLAPGTYSVQVDPSNFQPGGPLAGFVSSSPTEISPDGDVDINDNGIDSLMPFTAGISSNLVTLMLTTEPTGESGPGPGSALDGNSNLTVDFGFFMPLSLGNVVWNDVNENGAQDSGEPGVAGVDLQLLDGTGQPYDTNPAQPGIQPYLVTTDANGNYLFDALPPGTYIIEVLASNFGPGGALEGGMSSSGINEEPNPDSDGDLNDNGVDDPDPATNGIFSNPVTLDYSLEPPGEGDPSGNAADTDSNLTVDFGFIGLPLGVYAVPTLGEWALLLMAMMLAGFGVRRIRL